ncbi:hypothetical protein F4677DRAFT_402649 [Hypoxylon crocopeplum]|nr:hypothetical protein F4677DRAFT_402649 [Hypoxylon crocopeplum]
MTIASHKFTHRFGPYFRGRVLTSPFRALIDLTDPTPDDQTLFSFSPPMDLDVSNTFWVHFHDERVIYLPNWKQFRVYTFPSHKANISEFTNTGQINTRLDGFWIVALHVMYWMPPERVVTHELMMLTAMHNGETYLDRHGRASTDFQSDLQDCVMLFSPGRLQMVIESGLYGKGALRLPDSRFLVFIPGNIQPLTDPPIAQWNVLRAASRDIDHATIHNAPNLREERRINQLIDATTHNGDDEYIDIEWTSQFRVDITNGIKRLAQAIGSKCRVFDPNAPGMAGG